VGEAAARSKGALKSALLGKRKKEKGIGRAICLAQILFFGFAATTFPQSLDELSQKLRSGGKEEKRDALFALRSLRSEEASRIAVTALRDKNPMVRATAASSILFLPKSEAAAALTPLLRDKDEFVRSEAAYALGDVGDPAIATQLIRTMTGDNSPAVRSATAVALGKVGNPAAVLPLASILKTLPTEDTEMLRRAAARSIGQIAQILRSGNVAVLTPQNFLSEKLKDVDSKPSPGLLIQFRPAVETLIRVLDSSNEADDTRREAAFALGAIGDKSAEASLAKYAGSRDIYLAEIVKEALLKLRAVE
jgi:HEAT repeat protein